MNDDSPPPDGENDGENVIKLIRTKLSGPILNPGAPLRTAEAFVSARHTLGGLRTLHYHRDGFYTWGGAAYHGANEPGIRNDIYTFLDDARRQKKDGTVIPFDPNKAKVSDAMDALKAVVYIPDDVEPPAWIGSGVDSVQPAEECLCMANGLLHTPTRTLHTPTPAYFSLNAFPVAYDANAPDPEAWLAFLDSLWPDDPTAINALQEWFGYTLISDTQQEKIFMLVGPKRSGKGTIARTLTSLIGTANMASPSLNSMGDTFGLEPLIGKMLATITDARMGRRADAGAIAERLLSISGEDAVTVHRKFKAAWTGQLPARFLILTNELPRIADASGALASRFIIAPLTESFYGREDLTLPKRIADEIPAIFRWSLEGLDRLRERGHFLQPESARQAAEEMELLGAPVASFVRERCVCAPGLSCEVDVLFLAWGAWCEENGRQRTGTKQTFGRDLRAALPHLKTGRPRDGKTRKRVYEGIDLG